MAINWTIEKKKLYLPKIIWLLPKFLGQCSKNSIVKFSITQWQPKVSENSRSSFEQWPPQTWSWPYFDVTWGCVYIQINASHHDKCLYVMTNLALLLCIPFMLLKVGWSHINKSHNKCNQCLVFQVWKW